MPPRSHRLRRLPDHDLPRMTSLTETKRARRAAAMERRAAAHRNHLGAARQAAAHVLELISSLRHVEVISAYVAIRGELDPKPLMLSLCGLRYRVCVPEIVAKAQPLRFREWTPESRLVPGTFGVEIPEDGEELVPQVLIVPLLAFDRQCHRLGYGGGFYDRTIASLRERGPVHAIGFAYAAQEIEEVPVEETDMQLDAIVTEKGVIRPPGR